MRSPVETTLAPEFGTREEKFNDEAKVKLLLDMLSAPHLSSLFVELDLRKASLRWATCMCVEMKGDEGLDVSGAAKGALRRGIDGQTGCGIVPTVILVTSAAAKSWQGWRAKQSRQSKRRKNTSQSKQLSSLSRNCGVSGVAQEWTKLKAPRIFAALPPGATLQCYDDRGVESFQGCQAFPA